ncbi:MAG: ADP-glyceromanno-heptose 6-epimerase [Deltaproteobacteria bacterium]|nr:ADP-glyceromanno-heptose 6-epimerase [Candidatus Zymogenaceae bacterium]
MTYDTSKTHTTKRIVVEKKVRTASDRFIVTGGAGFIGANLVRALNERGYGRIIIVDNINHPAKDANLKRLRFEEYIDKTEFRSRLTDGRIPKVGCVFHLGACSSTTETNEAYLWDNNYRYTRDLCTWSLREGARFVYASSAATYGDGGRGYCDDDAVTPLLEPLNLYGRSKQTFDLWALKSGAIRRIAGLKYFNVYGPWEDHKGEMRSLVNKAYAQILETGEISLFRSHRPEYSDGEQDRDFIYVGDAVSVTLFFFDHPEVSGLFNCGTGQARTWIDLAKALFAAMEMPPTIRFIDMPESIRDNYQYHTQADMQKLRRAGYTTPFVSIEDGVRRYVHEHLSLSSGADGQRQSDASGEGDHLP